MTDNKWKYIWTNNGRIYLKQGDGEKRTFTFNYADEFADFKSKFPLGSVSYTHLTLPTIYSV